MLRNIIAFRGDKKMMYTEQFHRRTVNTAEIHVYDKAMM